VVDAAAEPCLVFRALCMRFFEGDTDAAALPMVKAGCVLALVWGKQQRSKDGALCQMSGSPCLLPILCLHYQ